MRNRQDLAAWLEAELATRNWTQSDLSRISGVHRAIISKIVLGGSKPTPETLEAISRALKIPPEQVFRAAGLLPPKPGEDPWVEENSHKLNFVPASMRQAVGRFIDSMVAGEEAASRTKPRAKSKPAKL